MSLVDQLQFEALEHLKRSFVVKYGVSTQPDWLPFHFAYGDVFIGLKFEPIKLSWRTLTTINDLFQLCFELSFIMWLAVNDQTDNPRELALGLFDIPSDFRTEDLRLRYEYRCSDKLGRVITFLPRQLPLQLYNENDYSTLIEWFDFDIPDYQAIDVFQGAKAVGYIYHFNYLIDRHQWKYNFTDLARKEGLTRKGVINRTLLEYAIRLINEPRKVYNYKSETSIMTLQQYESWENRWIDWILKQLEWIMLYHASGPTGNLS